MPDRKDVLPNDRPLEFTHGQPITLVPQPTESVVDKTLKSLADIHVLDEYRRDTSKPAEKIVDSDLQRKVRMARLEDKGIDQRLRTMDNEIKYEEGRAKDMGLLDNLVFKLGWAEGPETRKARTIAAKEQFISSIKAEQNQIGELMSVIESDPTLLEKAINRAYEEAQAIQRIALGRAIRAVNGGVEPTAEQAEQYAELVNKGEFQITDQQLKNAESIYAQMLNWFNKTTIRDLDGKPLTDKLAADLYNPVKQVQES